ncbi:MFS transporter [Sphingosinicella rhizophila]|uniref:MFS transporter n=1 Tax=Sphingosinicella rhizophila TaxID=3050082 RepID=A0ABU3QBR2_9SPHN|nr:MFS transporter [Sphingosinicella sp. GR2756]MDT9600845.1 MFS transporter [Sphingosinicella sp. GR2756]
MKVGQPTAATIEESPGYGKGGYAVALLTLLYTLTYIDRGLMTLLIEPIKLDLALSDTQLGFLTGIAFGVFHAVVGLPIARWADRGNRVTIASISIGLWALTVLAFLWIQNFVQMVAARIAAAVGEAGGMPPTYSLIGDYFPAPAARLRAMTVYMLAGPLASLISYMGGGWLNDRIGWRATFAVMAIPGLVTMLLVAATLKEPRKAVAVELAAARTQKSSWSVFREIWAARSSRHLTLGIVLLYATGFGLAPWYGAFMVRSHDLSTSVLGIWFGLIFGICGAIGILLGGQVSARFFRDDEAAQIRLTAFVVASIVPCFWVFLLIGNATAALLILIPMTIAGSFFLGPIFSVFQRVVGGEARATSMAIVMLAANLVGMGAFPQIVGIISDLLHPALGEDSLRFAMLGVSMVRLWSAYHFLRAAPYVRSHFNAAASAAGRARLTPDDGASLP